jgi:hypothetical protein
MMVRVTSKMPAASSLKVLFTTGHDRNALANEVLPPDP